MLIISLRTKALIKKALDKVEKYDIILKAIKMEKVYSVKDYLESQRS